MKKFHLLKPKLVKPKFFLGVPLALFSLEIYLGALSGYFLAKFLAGKQTGQSGIIKSLSLDLGKWRIHLHHWLIGSGILLSGIFYNYFPLLLFPFGFLGGLIFQGVFCYSDWYKILIKK